MVACSEAVKDGVRRNAKNQKKLKETLRKEERERNRLGARVAYELEKRLMEGTVGTAVEAAVI